MQLIGVCLTLQDGKGLIRVGKSRRVRAALLVCCVFAAGWASIGLLFSGLPHAVIFFPVSISLALLFAGWRLSGEVGSRGPHVRKLVRLWSGIEAAAIILSALILGHMHRNDLAFSCAVIIVGAHFLPLARGIPVRLYYATGTAMVLTGLAALLLAPPQRPLIVGMSAAIILWATALASIVRVARRELRQPSPA